MFGLIPFSISGFTALSATIFTTFLNFFSIGIADDNEGPAPITNTVFPAIFSLIFSSEIFFTKIEFKIIADSLSCFSLYLNSFRISEYFLLQPEITI